MDTVDPKKRSEIMSHIRGKNTKPELLIRSLLHRSGFRFRIHRRDLPGNHDIVLPKYKTVIFVHGCFWHQHPGCKQAHQPKSNTEYWRLKLERNICRDERNVLFLKEKGWKAVIIWECEISSFLENPSTLTQRIFE